MRSHNLLFLCAAAALLGACSFNWDTFQGPHGNADVPKSTDVSDASMDTPDTAPECTPASDTCPVGQYCSPGLNQCVSGCRNDTDCAGMSDGGAGSLHCATASHMCVPCVTDTHCPLGQLCMGSTCVEGCNASHACPSGRACCAGGCVDTQANAAHCGACGSACSTPNGTPTCIGGACAIESCRAGFGDCDRSANNGCETDTTTSLAHCGGCGMACTPPAHAAAVCTMGRCGMGMCDAGYADCDGNPMNGCEVNLRTDTSNCGTCGTVCNFPGATAACALGACVRTMCSAGMGDCDGNPAACEVTFATDVNNCGRCGNMCAFPHATASCAAGTCAMTRCDTGFGDCDGNPMNGCETDLTSSLANCGTCGNVCVFAGGTGVCRAGACALAACDTGRDNCDGMASNGCEVDLRSNLSNCGSCGRPCAPRPNSTSFCSSMVCGLTCASGFENCDAAEANGCETDVGTSLSNCGGCGRSCAPPLATGACRAGVCTVASCNANFGNCDAIDGNGCETDLRTTLAHCGACGRACNPPNATGICAAGTCRVDACTSGLILNCDGLDANGCEADLRVDNTNCGSCGNRCAAGRTCVLGRCTTPGFAGYTQTVPPAGVAWIDACALPGREVVLTFEDDNAWVGTLPFPVEFWGATNTDYVVQTNGFVGFGNIFYNYRPDAFPSTGALRNWGRLPTTTGFAPGAYLFGSDLVMSSSGVCIASTGAAPNRTWIAEFAAAHSYTSAIGFTSFTFEILAYETVRSVDFLYNTLTLPAPLTASSPDLVTIGIQDHFATPHASLYSGTVTSGSRIRFQPN
ncbi:MAG: hypothetical protein U0326_01760 [Polyangiales bacterium]